MDPLHRLATILADGRFHSGTVLAETLGVGRTTVWNHVKALERIGLEIFAVPRRGYRLPHPLELLDAEAIGDAMAPARRRRLRSLETLFAVDSTNRHVADAARDGLEPPAACLAEAQTEGRGRRGRSWVSPLGTNLYLSLLWQLHAPPGGPGPLSLAVGVAVARALESVGLPRLELKWPNDLLVGGRKVGGILIELSGDVRTAPLVVVGIGINVRMNRAEAAAIEQPWTDLASALGTAPSRNEVAGRVLDRIVDMLERYESHGASSFLDEWRSRDATRDRPVALHEPGGVVEGIARGVDETGALLVERDGEVRAVAAGEVTLRERAGG